MTSDSVWPASSSWLRALRSLARVQRWSILTWPSTPGPPAARAGFYWIFGTVASQRRTGDLLGRPGTVADPASRKGLALWPAILVAPTENASNAPLRAQRDEAVQPVGCGCHNMINYQHHILSHIVVTRPQKSALNGTNLSEIRKAEKVDRTPAIHIPSQGLASC